VTGPAHVFRGSAPCVVVGRCVAARARSMRLSAAAAGVRASETAISL